MKMNGLRRESFWAKYSERFQGHDRLSIGCDSTYRRSFLSPKTQTLVKMYFTIDMGFGILY